jgi:ferredoxin
MPLFIDENKCKGCAACVAICPSQALSISNGTPVIDRDLCNECLLCADECPTGAIYQVLEGLEDSADLGKDELAPAENQPASQPQPSEANHPARHPFIETASLVLGGATMAAGGWLKNYPLPGARHGRRGQGGKRRRRNRR